MKPQMIVLAAIIAGLPAAAISANPPEEAQKENAAPATSVNPFEDFFKQVQEKLRAQGFDAGPVDGTFNSKTQAALAQFQRSRVMPVSGALDDVTLRELGVEPPATSSPATAEAAPADVAAKDAERPPQ